ncbi:MAG: G1 family glutamic endopeptidase, partial [Pseudonocardiaceae bacterium]
PFSITLAPPPGASFNGNCVEWIMKAPDGGETTSSLPSFTQVKFYATSCADRSNKLVKGGKDGDTFNIAGIGRNLTAVTLNPDPDDVVTIDYIGR